MQEVFCRQEGTAQTVRMCCKGSVRLDDVASHFGAAAVCIQLQSSPADFVAMSGEQWTLKELQSLCVPTAGATTVSPIVIRPAPSAGEHEPCSAKLTPQGRASG